ncbi:hypothetical protein GHK92_10515 [Nocardioides sp. dk4132]|uniref:hypothetical protein n=1 Tax=unclassified Nocardioides TaxID=2615069 RepID=UPI001295191E|nr:MULTISPECIES: hypothetical protein [unclassified Nocardioides]MQW76309.1 hypothetical protein [Nocardioides sp. dk4132]QGA07408.1 hypothetical protein GFH29_08405 [Nocardioides sp. dk884]
MDAAQVQTKLELTPDEDFILTAWQYRMMQRDIAASKGKYLPAKREVRDSFRTAAVESMLQRTGATWSPAVASAVTALAGDGEGPNPEALEDAAPELSPIVAKRSRALLLLIDLYGFEPWTEGKWDKTTRTECLAEAHRALDQLHPEDLVAVETAYKEAIKKLSTAGSWTKYALLAGAGLGLGVLTGGLAAPAIAGAYGTVVLGYSGAVATTAGMAALGGGSIAAGGLGMAGGAALITSVTGAAGAGAAALGGRATGFTVAQVAADAIKLHVVTQLVLRDVDGNEEAAKAVIVSLRERVANLGQTIASLADRIETLHAQLETKQAEVDAERAQRLEADDRVARLRAVADRLKERVAGPEDEDLQELHAELDELKDEKKATETLAEGVTVLADDLEEDAA